MINLPTSNEIIKYRALGFSFDDITRLAGVSKPIVMKVCKDRQSDIEKAKAHSQSQAIGDIAKAITARKVAYNSILGKITSEMLDWDISLMGKKELTSLMTTLERGLATLEESKTIKVENDYRAYSDEDLDKLAKSYRKAK